MLRRNKSKALQKAANLGTIDIYPFGTLQKLKTAKIVPNRIAFSCNILLEFCNFMLDFCNKNLKICAFFQKKLAQIVVTPLFSSYIL
jgi:hypothetical protein